MSEISNALIVVLFILAQVWAVRYWPWRIDQTNSRLIFATFVAGNFFWLVGLILFFILPQKMIGLALMISSYGYLAFLPRDSPARNENEKRIVG